MIDRTRQIAGVIRDHNIQSTSFTAAGPLLPGNYSFEVQAFDVDGDAGEWSVRRYFGISTSSVSLIEAVFSERGLFELVGV